MSAAADQGAPEALQILVVGAGAVGQSYAHYLVRGGAKVTFYVRERYRAEVRAGFTILPLNRPRAAQRLEDFAVVSSVAEVAARRFDQVYLAIPSTGLSPAWLAELVPALGEATIVGLTPSPDDRDHLLAAGVPASRLVAGLISLVSYHAPLPTEARREAGTAVWFPPASPTLYSGPAQLTAAVIAPLRRGGLPAKRHPDVPTKAAFFSSVFMACLLGLEAAGWSFRALRGAPLTRALAGAHQAMAITAQTFGPPPWRMRMVLRPSVLRLALRLAPGLVPFPLEPYLRVHFTKVGAQTRLIVDATIRKGRAAGLPVDALQELLAAVPAQPDATT